MPRGEKNKADARAPFVPTEAEIVEAAREIRERGFRDKSGKWHAPWIEGNEVSQDDEPKN
jgi:hypothetical protein